MKSFQSSKLFRKKPKNKSCTSIDTTPKEDHSRSSRLSRCQSDKVVNKITLPKQMVDETSLDTTRSTPKASAAKPLLLRSQTQKVVNKFIELDNEAKTRNGKEDYALGPSVSFLSLVLPSSCDDQLSHFIARSQTLLGKEKEAPSIISVSDVTTTTMTTAMTNPGDLLSVTSGLTTLAKDRVQETITCSDSIHDYLNSIKDESHLDSPRSVQDFPQRRDGPINVDFVLESDASEIALFAKSYIQSKQFSEAIDIYLTVLEHYQKKFGPQYPFVITTLHNLGVVYVLKGRYKKAMYYCNEALRRRRKTLGSNHLDVATSLFDLGIIHYASEEFNKALDVLREALHIVCNEIEPKRQDCMIAAILNNIGCIHFSMGKLIASIATFEESLDVQRRRIGTVSSDEAGCAILNMSTTLCNAGIVSAKQNKFDSAASLIEEGLMVQQSVLPESHRVVSSTSKTLSRLLGQETHSDISPEIQMEIKLPRGWSSCNQIQIDDVLLSQCSDCLILGSAQHELNSQQRVSQSMNYKYLATAILSEGESKRHCSWVDMHKSKKSDSNFNLFQVCEQASGLIQQKEFTKATDLFNRIRRDRKNKCGDVNLIVSSATHCLGLIYLHTHNYQSARVEFQEAAKIRSRDLDHDHLDVLESQTKRAITMIALQDFDKALSIFQNLLGSMRKRFGYTHERVAVILNNIGICHYEFGGFLTALKSFEESVEILRDASEDCRDNEEKKKLLIFLGRALSNLSFQRFKRREFAESVVALEEALKVQQIVYGKRHKFVKKTIENLGYVMASVNCLDNKDKLKQMTKMYIEMLVQ